MNAKRQGQQVVRRVPWWGWLLIVAAGAAVTIAVPYVALPVALIALVTSIVGWGKGRRTWMRFRSRQSAVGLSAIATVAVVLAGGSAAAMAGSVRAPEVSASTSAGLRAAEKADAERDAVTPRPARTAEADPTPSPRRPAPVYREVAVLEAVAFAESVIEDPELPAGQTRVVTEGVAGQRTITYRVTEIDGEETERVVVSDVVSTPPVDRVVANGTYVAPPPPPPPPPAPAAPAPIAGSAGGCDPNYADACVPIDSDVDCAGGSGNGPSYFDGVARIVGKDIYELDRDGDGFACEPS